MPQSFFGPITYIIPVTQLHFKNAKTLLRSPLWLNYLLRGYPIGGLPHRRLSHRGLSRRRLSHRRQDVSPGEVVPQEVVREEVGPEEVIPEEVIPEEVVPQEVVPQEAVPRRQEVGPEEVGHGSSDYCPSGPLHRCCSRVADSRASSCFVFQLIFPIDAIHPTCPKLLGRTPEGKTTEKKWGLGYDMIRSNWLNSGGERQGPVLFTFFARIPKQQISRIILRARKPNRVDNREYLSHIN